MDGPGLLFVPAPFFIVGPTAVSKTALAVEAALLCGAEIISADAFQVYEGLARLTAKPSAADLARVRHHLVGHVSREDTYNVARFLDDASACLRDAAIRQRPVIVVGGSGLYVKALTHGLSPLPPAQPELRAELEATALPELVARLGTLDPESAGKIDLLNKRRVVRALEVCITTGGLFSEQQSAWQEARPPVRGVFLTRDKADLQARIDRRTDSLLDEESQSEVQAALTTPLSDTAARIIGLREISAFLAGGLTRGECLDQIRTATRRYAKRQMTWFRGESFAETIDLTSHDNLLVHARHIAAQIDGAQAV